MANINVNTQVLVTQKGIWCDEDYVKQMIPKDLHESWSEDTDDEDLDFMLKKTNKWLKKNNINFRVAGCEYMEQGGCLWKLKAA